MSALTRCPYFMGVLVIFTAFFQYMFVTEVDTSKKKAVHDELARLLVQYLRQQNSSGATPHKLKLLDVSAS